MVNGSENCYKCSISIRQTGGVDGVQMAFYMDNASGRNGDDPGRMRFAAVSGAADEHTGGGGNGCISTNHNACHRADVD
jgi:hypothetical protein